MYVYNLYGHFPVNKCTQISFAFLGKTLKASDREHQYNHEYIFCIITKRYFRHCFNSASTKRILVLSSPSIIQYSSIIYIYIYIGVPPTVQQYLTLISIFLKTCKQLVHSFTPDGWPLHSLNLDSFSHSLPSILLNSHVLHN